MSDKTSNEDSASGKDALKPDEFYLSPEGFLVFTEKYHLRRGYCCQSGCKHCPYGFDKKTGRIEKKKNRD
jgi:hypothetical protein